MSAIRLFLAALTLAVAPALSQEQPTPEDHVNFAIYDAGTALEIEWFFDEGAHFWGETIEVSVSDPGVTLTGSLVDETEGGTRRVWAEDFSTLPYTIDGERPDSVVVTIKARKSRSRTISIIERSTSGEPETPMAQYSLVPGASKCLETCSGTTPGSRA